MEQKQLEKEKQAKAKRDKLKRKLIKTFKNKHDRDKPVEMNI